MFRVPSGDPQRPRADVLLATAYVMAGAVPGGGRMEASVTPQEWGMG
jgi:hypothetical protein